MKLKQLLASPPIFNGMIITCSVVRIALLRVNILFAGISFILRIYNNADRYNVKIALIYDSLKHVGELALGFAQH